MVVSSKIQRRHYSPLRYPGGKAKVINFFKLFLLKNNLIGHQYIEVFAGGASVGLALLFDEYVSHIHINDFNVSVAAFWIAVLENTEELCRRIRDTPISVEEWERQKAVQVASEPHLIDLAFSTFFLNRTNRSGIINAGIIGGKNQEGEWKIDARFNKVDLIQRIERIAVYRNRITFTKNDAADYLRTVLPLQPEDALVYLDPPYYVKGEGLYQNYYQHADHVEISQIVSEISQNWIVSYDAVQPIMQLYDGFDQVEYGLAYSAAERYTGSEIMYFSPAMRRPDVASPANVPIEIVNRALCERNLLQ